MRIIWLLVAFGLGIVVGSQVDLLTSAPQAPVAQPTGDAPEDVEEEAGRIEVDFTGSDLAQSAFINRRNSKGREVDEPMKQPWDEDNVLWIDLAPGTYLAWWHNEKGEHAGVRVRVAEGRTTRVSVDSDLVRVLLGRVNDELRSNVTRISREAMECLSRYGWPGNVRELENVLMKAVALCPGNVLSVDMFPREFCRGIVAEAPSPRAPGLVSLERLERDHVARVLEATRWHRGQACGILGVSRPRLRRMIRQYGLESPPGVDAADDDPDEDSGD